MRHTIFPLNIIIIYINTNKVKKSACLLRHKKRFRDVIPKKALGNT